MPWEKNRILTEHTPGGPEPMRGVGSRARAVFREHSLRKQHSCWNILASWGLWGGGGGDTEPWQRENEGSIPNRKHLTSTCLLQPHKYLVTQHISYKFSCLGNIYRKMIKGYNLMKRIQNSKKSWTLVPALSLASYEFSGKLLNFSGSQFTHLKHGNNISLWKNLYILCKVWRRYWML